MSKDNLILFPKKSKPIIEMSNAEAKWMISASLLVVLTLAVGVNSTLFAGKAQDTNVAASGRSIASVNPLFKVSWEKKAFEVLDQTQNRELAHVGSQPSAFDRLAFGALEGKYAIRMKEGLVSQIHFTDQNNTKPKFVKDRLQFMNSNISLFAKNAQSAIKLEQEYDGASLVEKFQIKGDAGQDLRTVEVRTDKNNNLLSMVVQ